MSKDRITGSESEENGSEKELTSEEEEDKEEPRSNGKQEISDYEKQRLARIAENRARMEALGLSKMASSLMGSSQNSIRSSSKHKGKRKVIEEDEDYRPDDDDHERDDDLDAVEEEDDDEDEDFLASKVSRSRKTKVKNKVSKQRKTPSVEKHLSSSDYVEDDEELLKAIALSLQDVAKDAAAVQRNGPESTFSERKGNSRMKRKKSVCVGPALVFSVLVLYHLCLMLCFLALQFTSRQQMTEDEMVIHFFQFDEAGKGCISARDLEKVAMAYDFVWTDKEIADMIRCFDADGDGKLSLDDFRKIVSRCNMLQTSENS